MKISKCPYCSKQLTFFQAFFLRSKGEYFCNKCKKESNVMIRKALILPFIIALLLSLVILFLFLFKTDRSNLWFMFFVTIPFIIFYFITPFFVELRPRKKHMDVLYDTEMVESPFMDPDPTVAKTSKVVPAFVDDVVLTDHDKPVINAEIFNAIKERKVVEEESSGDTKSFFKVESSSDTNNIESTMPVKNLKDILNSLDNDK